MNKRLPPAIILCGGLGTRLAKELPNIPKGLAPINQKAFLDIQIKWLEDQGITEIILATGHKSDQIEEHFAENPPKKAKIQFSKESTPLGTGGALINALDLIQSPTFFALNGDSFCETDLTTLQKTHLKNHADITLTITPLKNTSRFGTITINNDSQITSFNEKTASSKEGYINAGIYCISHKWLSQFKNNPMPLSLEKDIFETHLGKAMAVISNSSFIDIGTPESLELASHFQFNTRPKKLTIISQLFYPELISTGQSLTELAEAMTGISTKISVWCAYPSLSKSIARPPKTMTHHTIAITRVWSTTFPKLNLVGKLLNHLTFSVSIFLKLLVSQENHPLLIPTNPPFLAAVVCTANLIKKRPLHYAIYDVYPDTAVECQLIQKTSLIATLWNKINQWIWTQVTSIIVIGKCMETLIKNQSKKAIHSKIHYIPLWVDTDTLTPIPKNKNKLINDWNLQDKFVVLYAGNMGRFHDITSILEAAKTCATQDPNIQFVFVGDGQKKQEVLTYIQKNNLQNCQVHAYVDREQLSDCLSTADIGLVTLLPKFIGLSIPSKALSLMAAKCPIIAILPPKSEMANILTHFNAGIVVSNSHNRSLANEILSLKSNPDRAKTMAENGYLAAKNNFNRKKIAALYKSLILDYT